MGSFGYFFSLLTSIDIAFFSLWCITSLCGALFVLMYCIVLYCIVLYCIVLYCIVLYCIMRSYTEGRLDRYRIGIPRELSEIRTQTLAEWGIFNLRFICYLWASNHQPFDYWRKHHIYYVASDHLIGRWRALSQQIIECSQDVLRMF